MLFAVNAGTDDVSVFATDPAGPQLLRRAGSGVAVSSERGSGFGRSAERHLRQGAKLIHRCEPAPDRS